MESESANHQNQQSGDQSQVRQKIEMFTKAGHETEAGVPQKAKTRRQSNANLEAAHTG